jgi:hypothetical protein
MDGEDRKSYKLDSVGYLVCLASMTYPYLVSS